MGRQLPVTVALAAILERSFPEEYEARRAETRTSAAASANGTAAAAAADEAPLPLFVMSVMMPGAHACIAPFMLLNWTFQRRASLGGNLQAALPGMHICGMRLLGSQGREVPRKLSRSMLRCQLCA